VREFKGHKYARTCGRSERRQGKVDNGVTDRIAKAFKELHPDNPMRKLLNASDRKYVWALLILHDRVGTLGGRDVVSEELDGLSKIATDAAKLSARMRSQVFEGTFSENLSRN
jgi:hypothetical protein